MLKDAGDKISEDDKKKLTDQIEEAKKDFASDDIEVVKSALEKLQKESQEVVTKLYANANANAGANAGAGADGDNINVNPEDVKVDDGNN